MSTFSQIHSGSAAIRWSALLVGVCLSGILHAEKKAAPPPLEHKDYTLFMGADFLIQRDHTLYPVVDVVGDSFVIKVKDERVLVPVGRGELKIRVDEALKLTPEEAGVSDLTAERAYTPARDPRKKFMRENMEAGMTADLQATQARANGAAKDLAGLSRNPDATPLQIGKATVVAEQTQFAAAASQSMARDMQYTNGSFAGRMQDELAKELYDAMEIEFKVSSPKPLARPYIIVVAVYRASDDRSNSVHNWIYAQQLNPIGSRVRREHFLKGGLTPGFTLISTEFHLYNEGKEIATDVAHKRVALTREEAFEYLVMEYVAGHKGGKAVPTPAMAALPGDFLNHLSQDEVLGTYYVKVGADGKVREVYKDEACTMKVDDGYLASGLRTIWFEPALEKGKPVEGVAKVHPNKLKFAFEAKI